MAGVKFDQGKLRWELFPWDACDHVVKVLNGGAVKYTERNWEQGISYSRLFGAAVRHMSTWFLSKITGESSLDPETGVSHLAHAICCLFFILTYEVRGMHEWDDRPTKKVIKKPKKKTRRK